MTDEKGNKQRVSSDSLLVELWVMLLFYMCLFGLFYHKRASLL